jgi:PAS domain S-box-containing protein
MGDESKSGMSSVAGVRPDTSISNAAAQRESLGFASRPVIALANRPLEVVLRYVLSLIFVAAALGGELALQRFLPYPFFFLFFAAVMASAWFGGTAPGLFAVATSTVAVDYYFIPPHGSLTVNAANAVNFAAFVVCALVANWVSSKRKESENALKEARDQLEAHVAERTAELQTSNEGLRERERQLRLLTEVIPQQIWSAAADGFVDYCNQRLLDYVGRSIAEMQGAHFIETIHPEDAASFRDMWQRALVSGQAFEGQIRFRSANGAYRSFFTRGVPLQDAAGRTIRWYATNTDIEEREKAEQALQQTREELAHLSRFMTMGELTASIAHEVDQPLTAIVAYGHALVEWLSVRPPNIAEAQQAAQRVIQDGTRAGAVLHRIRAIFRKENAPRTWIKLNDLIQDMNVFVREEAARSGITIRMELAADLPPVKADRVQMEQVLLNLMMNSIDAVRGIEGCTKEIMIRTAKHNSNIVLVSVEDSGDGIPPAIAAKIFEPFFTTKSHGIGMGLAISRSIIESHGGRLWTGTCPEGGAIFQFTVPVSA